MKDGSGPPFRSIRCIFFTLAVNKNVMVPPVIITRAMTGDLIHNYPVVSLIFANLVTIALAILGNWDLATVIFIYWAQSVIIGIFTVLSLLGADTAALGADLQKPLHEQGKTDKIPHGFTWFYQCLLAGFFALHYGLFHWGYYGFIVESGIFGPVNFTDPGIWLSCGLFFANHLYSHITFRYRGAKGGEYVTEQFITPYRRIIPMHMTIIFGSIVIVVLEALGITSTMPVLVLFLLLKTYSDISAHRIKHYREENPDAPVQYL